MQQSYELCKQTGINEYILNENKMHQTNEAKRN
jgi:hypothetical protein